MSSPDSVLVLGAGELGSQIIRSLATHPKRRSTRIAVLLRPSSITALLSGKRKDLDELKALDIDFVPGEVPSSSIEELAATMKPFHTVVGCVGYNSPPGTQKHIAEAVLSAGIKRYFPWQFGVDYDFIGAESSQDLFTEQLGVRNLLRSQDEVDWVIVSTGMFISFLFEPSFDLVNASRTRVTAIGSWGNHITVTSPEDIGKITAELVLACPEVKGIVYTAGDTVSMQRLADIVDKVTGKPVERRLKDVSQLEAELTQDPNNAVKKYRVVFGEGKGVSWAKAGSFNVERGIATQNVEEWAQQNIL